MAIAYIYKGKSGFLSGVPAHDLTREEFDRLPDSQQAAVKSSSLYEVARGDAAKRDTVHEDITLGGAGGTKRVIATPGAFVPEDLVDRLVPYDQVKGLLAPHTVKADAHGDAGSAVNPPSLVAAPPAEDEDSAEAGATSRSGKRSGK